MPTYTRLPDGKVVAIPDDATPAELAELELLYSGQMPQEAPARTTGQELLRQLGLTARAGATGLTGAVGVAGDALNTGINMTTGSNLQMPSEMIQRFMDQIGLPKPETELEKFSQFGASVLAGGMDPAMGAVTKALTPKTLYQTPPNADPRAAAINEARQAGVMVTPHEAHAGTAGRLLEDIAGRNALEGRVSEKNAAAFNALARRAIGLPEDTPLTPEVLRNLMDETYTRTYEPIQAVGRVPAMPGFQKAMREIAAQSGVGKSFPDAASDEVARLASAYNVPHFDTADAMEAIKKLRGDARASYKAGKGGMGEAQRAVAKALEDNIEEYLGSEIAQGILPGTIKNGKLTTVGTPRELLGHFRSGRTELAKQHAVDRALVEGSGSVDALNLAAQMGRGAPLTDELATIARFANVAPKSAAHPQKAAQLVDLPSVIGGLGGYGIHPALGMALGARPFVRLGLTSKTGQKLFANPVQHGPVNPMLINAMPTLGSGLFGVLE